MSDQSDGSGIAVAFACALFLFGCVAVLFVPAVIAFLWSIEVP